jgi:hypothetical protein
VLYVGERVLGGGVIERAAGTRVLQLARSA